MRILHVSSEHPPQQVFGLGRYVCDLSRELAKQGHEVHVLTNSIGGGEQDVLADKVHLHRVDFPPPPKPPDPVAPALAFNLHLQQRAATLGAKQLGDPQVVVSHDWLTAIAGHNLARRFGVPHVWTVHDTVYGKRLGKVEADSDKVIFDVEAWAADAADRVLVNSLAIGEELERAYEANPKKIGLLTCGIDLEQFQSKQSVDRLAAFRQVFAGDDELLITYVGRLDHEKGIDTLINAFSIFHKRYPSSKLALAGRGALLETIEAHVQHLGLQKSVRLYGYLRGEVLKSFYRISSMHVCPSLYEPFGLVAIEAMACGVPLIASNVGGLREIVSDASVGRVFSAGNHDELCAKLLELAGSRVMREKLGLAGMNHIREKYDWVKIAPKAVEHYQGLSN